MKKILLSFFATICTVVGFAQNHDLNGDGEVNSSDVVALYNSIASGGSSEEEIISNQTIKINNLGLTVSFNMIAVKGGTFQMGATSEQQDPNELETPVHHVTLTNYYIGETEVTQALWKTVIGNNPSYYIGDDNPVECVSWNDCQEFIKKLNILTSKNFRLPTEAEWEFAARGGNKNIGYQYSGSDNLDDVAWYWKNSGDNYLLETDDEWDWNIVTNNNSTTHSVKTKQSNELGIYDMSGNVWEWCQDWAGYYNEEFQFNPQGPTTGASRIFRGGCWGGTAWTCRTSVRNYRTPETRDNWLGFRLVLPPNDAMQKYDLNNDKEVNSSDVVALYNFIALNETSGGGNNSDNNENNIKTQTFTIKGIPFKMIPVAAGTFIMGATPEQQNPNENEKPVHIVKLDEYYIGETEVTQALWTAVMGNNPSKFTGTNNPVEQVSWNDCQDFIKKINILTGKKFRLPTEAEWEFAARGGNKSKGYQYSGSNNLDDVAWYSGSKRTHPVKTKQANELGIYDMSGNVREWCQDWYSSDYYSVSDIYNPQGPDSGSTRVTRGGSFFSNSSLCRSADRGGHAPDEHFDGIGAFFKGTLGFRLALSE